MKISKINRLRKNDYYIEKRVGTAKQFRGNLFITNGI